MVSAFTFDKQKIFVITNISLDIYQKTDDVKLFESINWFRIQKLMKQGNVVTFKFDKAKFAINSNKADQIFGAAGHIFKQIFTKTELKDIGIADLNFQKIQMTEYPALLRLRLKAQNKGIEIPQKSLEKMLFILRYLINTVSLSDFQDSNYVFTPLFFDLLPLCSFITTLKIPLFALIPNLQNYCKYMNKLKAIEFQGKSMKKLIDILKSLLSQECEKSKLTALSFVETDLSVEELQALSSFCHKKRITSLALHEACSKEAKQYLTNNFFTNQMSASLTTLNLAGTKGLDIAKLLGKLPGLYALSLSRCNLQIAQALNVITSCNLPRLKFLDLSYNPCNSMPSVGLFLPQTLYSLVVDGVEWEDKTLINFMKFIVFGEKQINGLKLSLSNAKASNEEWRRVFAFLKITKAKNLCALTWDNNPLSEELFDFIYKNVNLSYLSLCGCIAYNDQENLNRLSNFVAVSPSLLFLRIRGSQTNFIGQNISTLLKSASKSNSLVHLDISDNKIGDIGITQLRQFIKSNKTLQVLVFDGSEPNNPHLFFETLETAAKPPNQLLNVSFPVNDVTNLVNKGRITAEKKKVLMNHFMKKTYPKPIKTNKKVVLNNSNSNPYYQQQLQQIFPIPESSPFINPFCIFRHTPAEPFPQYLTFDQIDILKKTVPTTPYKEKSKSQILSPSFNTSAYSPSTVRSTRSTSTLSIKSSQPSNTKTTYTGSSARSGSTTPTSTTSRKSSLLEPRQPETVPLFLQQNIVNDDGYDPDTSDDYISSDSEREEQEEKNKRVRAKYTKILADKERKKHVSYIYEYSDDEYEKRSNISKKEQQKSQESSFLDALKSAINKDTKSNIQNQKQTSSLYSPQRKTQNKPATRNTKPKQQDDDYDYDDYNDSEDFIIDNDVGSERDSLGSLHSIRKTDKDSARINPSFGNKRQAPTPLNRTYITQNDQSIKSLASVESLPQARRMQANQKPLTPTVTRTTPPLMAPPKENPKRAADAPSSARNQRKHNYFDFDSDSDTCTENKAGPEIVFGSKKVRFQKQKTNEMSSSTISESYASTKSTSSTRKKAPKLYLDDDEENDTTPTVSLRKQKKSSSKKKK